MDSIYYDASKPGSFGGVKPLEKASGDKGAKEWLASQRTYTLHRPIRRKFTRQKTLVLTRGEQYQADLVDLSSLSKHNNGHKFLLTCIDVFSRYAWCVPLKDKSGKEVLRGFKKIFKDGDCLRLQTDDGKEFLNRPLQKYLKSKGIKHFSTKSEKKAAICERFNRTLKEKMWRYFTYKNTRRYLRVLPKLMEGYNGSFHRSIGMAPKDVSDDNEAIVWQRLYGKQNQPSEPKFKVGDAVRITTERGTFQKGYEQKWSEEIFRIVRVNKSNVATYILEDLNGDRIEGRFYEPEVQKVVDSGTYIVEKVLQRKGKNVFVKWLGYPSSMCSWIPASELKRWTTSI